MARCPRRALSGSKTKSFQTSESAVHSSLRGTTGHYAPSPGLLAMEYLAGYAVVVETVGYNAFGIFGAALQEKMVFSIQAL